jgi:hypothetical protein
MPLGSTGACLEGIDDEPFHEINTVGRIKRLPHRPEFGEMPTIDARHCVINSVPRLPRLNAPRPIYLGARRQNERGNMLRISGGDLNRNGCAGMMADDRGPPNAECDKELVCSPGPIFDRRFTFRECVRVTISDRIHRNGAVMPTKKRKHVAKFVPGSRRLMQQQHRRA